VVRRRYVSPVLSYRAGVESSGGSRKQEFLDSAKYFAANVINNSGNIAIG
jgi:hypothetical protein